MIKSIRQRKKELCEFFLVWNAYNIINKKTISINEKQLFAKKEGIKYTLTISNKNDCIDFFKKVLNIILTNDKVNKSYEEI